MITPSPAFRVAVASLLCSIAALPGPALAALSAEERAALASPSTVRNQEHGTSAFNMARRLGTEKRVDALEAIVAMKAPRLVDVWREGLGGSTIANERGQESPREVAAVEAAVLAQLEKAKSDARMTESLAQVFATIRWRSRATFDLLKARAIGPVWPPETRFHPLFNTANPELGEPLFALRDAIPSTMRGSFLAAMTRLKVTAARPFVEEALMTRRPGELFVADLARTLLALDERFPPPAMLARIRQDREGAADSIALQDAATLLGVVADDKSGRPLDYRALRASLGDPVAEPLRPGLVRAIQAHRVTEGRVDLVALVAAGGVGADYAASVAASIPDPDLWKRALDSARATKAREPENRRLDYPITQLEKNLAQGAAGAEAMKRESAAQDARMRTSLARQRFDRLLLGSDASPEAAAELAGALEEWKRSLDGAGPEGDTQESSLRAGRYSAALWYRFRQADARKALAEFDRLAQEGMVEAAIAAADTLQHELGDAKGALARFEALLARRKAERAVVWARGNFHVDERWLRKWLAAEISRLKGGKRFGGEVTLETAQQAGAAVFLMEAGMPGRQGLRYAYDPVNVKRILAEIRAAKPSRFAVATLQALLAYPETGDLTAELLRNDDAGFLSGQFLGNLLANADPGMNTRPGTLTPDQSVSVQRSLDKTAKTLTKATGMRFRLEPDPAYATPEKTWDVFRSALRRGDRAAAVACFTPNVLGKWGPVLEKLAAADMKTMADSVRTFAPVVQQEHYAEYAVGREGGAGGIVSFAKHYGEWKIAQM